MPAKLSFRELPIPSFFDPVSVGQVWPVPYQDRASQAEEWAEKYNITPSANDDFKIAFIGIDVQNTFCIPGFELFVAGRSGIGAVEDNRRMCEFIYRNLANITHIAATLDTHTSMQIFHPIFLINDKGENPPPMTMISYEDLLAGKWKFNPAVADSLGISPEYGQRHVLHYSQELHERQKYDLTIWPYHVMLGSVGHAMVSAFEEAAFFHTMVRKHQNIFTIKGNNPLTEHYSAIGPEVLDGPGGERIATKSATFLRLLKEHDAVIIAGQAKSHCVAWTISDLLEDIYIHDNNLSKKVFLLEDCTSSVVIPGVVDYSDKADEAFQRFAESGMHLVRSTDPMNAWPGLP